MSDAQDCGMQGLALQWIRAFGRAIDLVSQQGMADTGQMHPDLMGTAGFQLTFHISKTVKPL